MLDPKLLRESPGTVRAAIAKKHLQVDLDAVIALDNAWRALLQETETLRSRQKAANGEMAKLPKGSPEFIAKVAEMKAVSAQVKEKEAALKDAEEKCRAAMLSLPNIPHESVPEGATPEQNVVFSTHGDIAALVSPHAKPHYEIDGFNKLFDFDRGAKVTGAGFPFYVGDGAKIVRALLQFFLDEDTKAGYTEVNPPIFVNEASATAVGQLPDKEGMMYETIPDRFYAIPTAETPLTNFFRDEIIDEAALPVCRCAYTPCFRREAGSYGKDVRGLNRLHQFDKVELLKWVHPSKSYEEHDKLRDDAERLLQKLGLPYRVLLMCGGDLGFSQAKKYDLEVWSGGQKRWLEVSSCSNFESFQARRAQIRFRGKDGKPELVHTLNGSGLAIPRVLSALLENNLQADGRVKIPAALAPYFGKEYLSFA
ncbi:seryl-tRNA synthetase [Ereboglobus sp. PH5-5]|uniref:serine--tRNA ligase n=1 Tax=unclassified Ereboglobus TaxID=2626932 RepID=UPI002406AFDC|nr:MULTISPECIES: serine--tRNA ligase [unclassified Ereboglobus]MDF9827528.1 seryl-tRNA synthetase [Ereboglobus sp. PH5-10]MDF9833115.1 seryl-tRNA synthetase [Ereboglobus sp. PH5-5]